MTAKSAKTVQAAKTVKATKAATTTARNASGVKASTGVAAKSAPKKAGAKKPVAERAGTTKSATTKAATNKAATTKAATTKAASTKAASTKAATTRSPAKQSSAKRAAATATPTTPAVGAPLVAVGAPAPEFTLPDGGGRPVALSSLRGGPVVLYFYPKDDTSGCTAEACDFRDNLAAFRKLGCTVLGVSPDSVASHAKFTAKHALGKLTLLADEPDASGTPAVCAAYGVWQQKSMYGRAYMGVVRTTYVIAADGTVAARFDKVSVTDHAAEVLKVVRGL